MVGEMDNYYKINHEPSNKKMTPKTKTTDFYTTKKKLTMHVLILMDALL